MTYYKDYSQNDSKKIKQSSSYYQNNSDNDDEINHDDNKSMTSMTSMTSTRLKKSLKNNPYYKYKNNKCNNRQCMQYGRCICNDDENINIDINDYDVHNEYPHHLPPIGHVDPLRKFDYDSMNDDFTPPFRRSYYDEYNYRLHPGLYPTYTRGPPGRFRKIGVLIADGVSANDKFKFLILMGRQKYPGREYEYFATSSDNDQRLKFFIETKGKEINDNDTVKLSELDGYSFKFKEDQDLSPRYDPYIL